MKNEILPNKYKGNEEKQNQTSTCYENFNPSLSV